VAALLGLVALVVWSALGAQAGAAPVAHAAARPCSSYPVPGTSSSARVPRVLGGEYNVLTHRRRASDEIALRRLGSLPENGILIRGIHRVGSVQYGGQAYLVPALHLLASTLAPARCLPRSQRALQNALLPNLRKEYTHYALCLVIVYKVRATPACESAPGSADAFLYGPGTPGLGIAPDGIPAVRLSFRKHRALRAVVHNNFWIINDPKLQAAPCGLQWITRTGVVLRTVASCDSTEGD
jgi:hypothetical protein